MKIGHTKLTCRYVYNGNGKAHVCEVCGTKLTVKNIVQKYMKYDERVRHRIEMKETIDTALGP